MNEKGSEDKKQILRSPPPNLPHRASSAGPLVRSGTPFAQNDGVVYLRVIGETDGRAAKWRANADSSLTSDSGLRACGKANADSSTHHPRTYPTEQALRGPWCVRGPR